MGDAYHVPVLFEECMRCLNVQPGGTFVDGTLGGGGHSEGMLQRGARVIGIDRDEEALAASRARLHHFAPLFTAVHDNYANIGDVLDALGIDKVDGVLLDLGVSSHQIDTPERGFSYHEQAPLDMRMDKSQGITAADVLNTYPEAEISRILRDYGEERWAARIAQFIVKRRPLGTTGDLVAAIDAAVPAAARNKQGGHPARRTFQAVRIEVNAELAPLEGALDAAMARLKIGGRLAVITFHSLEDRIVKNAFRRMERPCVCPPELPICVCGRKSVARVITRKPIEATQDEVARNNRAHSAKLRCAEHIHSEE
jgi:16S rRNA (cytosine1402-N4)-methyltransferase